MRNCRTGAGALAVLLLVGSASVAEPSSNEAKPLQAMQQAVVCAPVTAIVCGAVGGQLQSYWNECLARRDGAIVVSTGECPDRSSGGVGGGGGAGGM